jgi:hypothetical protein
VVAIGLAVVGVAAPASASEPVRDITSTCAALTVNLSGYTAGHDAVEEVLATEGQEYIPPTFETVVVTPAIPAVTHIELQFTFKNENNPNSPRWEPEGWNSESNPESLGWHQTDSRVVIDSPAVPEVTAQVQTDPGQPYIAATEGIPAVEAATNHVTVTIDGNVQADADFDTSYGTNNFYYADSTSPHTWTVTVTAWDDESVYTLSGTSTPCSWPVEPAGTAAGCDTETGITTSGDITIPTTTGVVYSIDGVVVSGKVGKAPGVYTVTAAAAAGYVLAETAISTYDVTVGGVGECLTPTTPSDPTAQDQSCDLETGGVVGGSITVGDLTNVDYTIDGAAVTDLTTVVDPGEHTVVARPKAGHRLQAVGDQVVDESGQISWTLTVVAADNCDIQLPSHAAFPASASATNQTCTAGSTTSGFISVAFVLVGDVSAVQYFIGDRELTTANTAVAPGTYTVTAVARDAVNDTIEGTDSWTLTVAAVATTCGELKTLAFTGVNGNLGGMILLGMFLLIGGAGVYTSTRVRFRRN